MAVVERGLNKSQCMDCLPKKSGRCREVAFSGGFKTVYRMVVDHIKTLKETTISDKIK